MVKNSSSPAFSSSSFPTFGIDFGGSSPCKLPCRFLIELKLRFRHSSGLICRYDFIRYSTLAVLPPSKHGVLEYYLADYCSAVKGKQYRLMILIGPMYNVWLLCVLFLFNRMMYGDKRYRYWLRFFQIPSKSTPDQSKLVGYSSEKLAKFWTLSSSYQNIYLKSIFIQGIPAMSMSAISYLAISQKFSYLHSAPVFWIILIVRFPSSLVFKSSPNLQRFLN